MANLFGSVSIFIDRPFQIGDWVEIDGSEGEVEEVGTRSTRIRTFDDTLVSMPNASVASAAINNYGARRYRRGKYTLGLTYDTPTDRIHAFVQGVRGILAANPDVQDGTYSVVFSGFSDSSLDVLMTFFVQAPSWAKEIEMRHHILLEVVRFAEAVNVEFAFPTRTLHVLQRRSAALGVE